MDEVLKDMSFKAPEVESKLCHHSGTSLAEI